MNKPVTEISDVPAHKPTNLLPSVAKVNLVELRELLDDREHGYTQGQIAIFTRRFSNKVWKKAVNRTQVNKFLNGNLPTSSLDFDIIKRTLEWLMGVEIIHDTTLEPVGESIQRNRF